MTRIIAHRGASAAYPENSLSAFSRAQLVGADSLEVDLRRSKDNKIYCYHDRQLGRLTGHRAEFENTDSSAIDRMKLHSQEPILSFESFLASFGDKIGIVLDIKSTGLEQAIITMTGSLSDRFPLVFSSFDAAVISGIRQLRPPANTALIVGPLRNLRPRFGVTDYLLKQADHIGCNGIHLNRRLAGRRRIERLLAAGLSVCLWTVDDTEAVDKYVEQGVSGIISNVPEKLIRHLAATGRREGPLAADD
jgi:glycerophosphoryl diester phosphodiesterase